MATEQSGPSDIESNFGTSNDGPQYDKCIYGDGLVEPAGATAGAGSTNFSGKQYASDSGGGSSVGSPADSTTMTVNQGDFAGRGKGDNANDDPAPTGKQY